MRSNISNTIDSVSSGYPNTEKRVENTTRSGVFLTSFKVFGNVIAFNGPGARFSKLPVITGPVKMFCFPFQTGVSKGLKVVQ